MIIRSVAGRSHGEGLWWVGRSPCACPCMHVPFCSAAVAGFAAVCLSRNPSSVAPFAFLSARQHLGSHLHLFPPLHHIGMHTLERGSGVLVGCEAAASSARFHSQPLNSALSIHHLSPNYRLTHTTRITSVLKCPIHFGIFSKASSTLFPFPPQTLHTSMT
jgi:hypothetical protein